MIKTFLDNLTHKELNQRLRFALSGAGLGIWDWDLRTNDVHFDAAWCRMLGLHHSAVKMEWNTWKEHIHPDDFLACYQNITAHIEGKTKQYENIHRMRHADGRWIYILDRGRISDRDADDKPIRFTGTHFDVTVTEEARLVIETQRQQLVKLVARESELARTDSLTGLTNKRGFMESLEQEMERCRRVKIPLCIAFLDLDNFKNVNDIYGHAAGDNALLRVADGLKASIRGGDVVARAGGDEFLILLWNSHSIEQLERIGRRWISVVSNVAADFPDTNLGASVGIAWFDSKSINGTDSILKTADEGMYESKRQGRGRVSIIEVMSA